MFNDLKTLRLTRSFGISNITLIDHKGFPTQFDKIYEVMDCYYEHIWDSRGNPREQSTPGPAVVSSTAGPGGVLQGDSRRSAGHAVRRLIRWELGRVPTAVHSKCPVVERVTRRGLVQRATAELLESG